MSPFLIGICGIIAFIILIMLKVPIAVSMSMVGFVGVSYLVSMQAAFRILASEIYSTFSSYSLSVTPMFVLMGFFAYHAGIGNKLYHFAYKAIGHLKGGLAMASVASGGGLYNNPAERSLVIYGITTEQSISRLFIAGIIPGILLTLMYIAVIWLTVSKVGYSAALGPRASFKEKSMP